MKIVLTAALIAVGAMAAMTSVSSSAKAQGFYNYEGGDDGGGGYRRGGWGDDDGYRPRRPRGPGYPCSGEGGFCAARPGALILFGAGNSYARRRNPGGGLYCNNRTFGYDPYPGVRKACYVRN
jgi:hypothetical protein